jgi:hypothetical protein
MVDNHVYTLGKACSLGPHMLLRQENSDYYNYKFSGRKTQATTLLFPSNHKQALRGGLSSQGSFSHNSSLVHSTDARAPCSRTQCAIDSAEITLLLDECTLERWGTASIYAVNSSSTRCNNGL